FNSSPNISPSNRRNSATLPVCSPSPGSGRDSKSTETGASSTSQRSEDSPGRLSLSTSLATPSCPHLKDSKGSSRQKIAQSRPTTNLSTSKDWTTSRRSTVHWCSRQILNFFP